VRAGSLTRRGAVRLEAESPIRVQGWPLPGVVEIQPTGENRLDVINIVPLEAYVERAVAGEVYADWPIEALKAQAVVARSYVLHACGRRTDEPFDVESSVLSQRYAKGRVHRRIREAVGATRGEFLAHDGVPILAAFHTVAGGETAASEEVWGEPLPYLTRVDSPDVESPEYFWSYEIELDELRDALEVAGVEPGEDNEVRVLERTPSGRVARVEVLGAELSGRDLRRILGVGAFRSTLFDVRVHEDRVRFLGSGAGHGVGLSQWGARQMADKGRSYGEILKHYFPNTKVQSLSTLPPVGAGEEEAP
jgi:stage II sporulation protein D